MKPASLWLRLFAVGFLVICALLVQTLLTPAPYGDLSRLGRLSDNEFGWRAPAPEVPEQYLQPHAPADADVLVIGDSFSMTGRWQSTLAREGLKVSTVFWAHYGESLCADFDAWVAASGFRGQLIIIESVERLLRDRLERSAKCQTMKRPMRTGAVDYLPPPQLPHGFHPNWSAPLTNGWITYFNTRHAREATDTLLTNLNAKVRPVADGCRMFSHRLCDKALFYGDDDENGELGAAQVEAMKAFSRTHTRIPILWMIVPNKTTVYAQPEHSHAFVQALDGSGLGPDLFAFAQDRKRRIRDFYFPNDTHMSMHGQLAMGEVMREATNRFISSAPSGRP